MASDDTPLMLQWREIKARHPDALLFFRVGDFYELFNEDAEEGSRLLGLTLTSRNNGSSRAPLAGVPVHALNSYLQRLVRAGRRVAICEQAEDPALAKGIVRREVVETVTPGVVFADALLDERRNNYLAALAGSPGDADLGLAVADLTTGELRAGRCSWARLGDVLGRLAPAELLLPRAWQLVGEALPSEATRTYRADWLFDPATGADTLRRRFGVLTLEGYGLSEREPEVVGACSALLGYLAEVQPTGEALLRPPQPLERGEVMHLDEMTRRNLELVEPLRGTGTDGTLLGALDLSRTAMGARLLRRWLVEPLRELVPLVARQDAVADFVGDAATRRTVRAACSEIRDLERLAVKVASARANPRELLALLHSLEQLPALAESLASASAALLVAHRDALDPLPDVRALLARAIDVDAPVAIADGNVVRAGFDAELDDLRTVRDGAVDFIARLQAAERERTGIGSLKIGYNRVFGYYLEVSRANAERVPDDYQRRQTLANAERYITPELKEWEERVLGAEERIAALETRLFAEVRQQVAERAAELQGVAGRVAEVDVLAALAELAATRGYARPTLVADGEVLEIRGGRHPVVELMMPREEFIPNDVRLDADARVMILTGPNMAGKSTVLRQVGLIVLLAQIGSFVPAGSATVGLVDRIFTRVGASDQLARGQSTFMVEMIETAAILHGATSRSLVLLDEIGRGTSTWDGLSVATAVTEHLHERIGAWTIFATHYHELTRLAERLPRLVNFSVAVREEDQQIVFLRRLVAGGADRSYGVEVARLAGLPAPVVERARHLLHELEADAAGRRAGEPTARPAPVQLALFDAAPHPALERLRELEVERMTPLQAIAVLAELAETARTDR